MKKLEAILAAFLMSGCASEPTAEQQCYQRLARYGDHREMRTAGGHDAVWNLRRVQHIFQENGWNANASQNYGYTFVHPTPAPLRELSHELGNEGYHLARLELVPDDGQWWLQLHKREAHSPESLHELNVRFSKLGEERGILYEGWDVEWR